MKSTSILLLILVIGINCTKDPVRTISAGTGSGVGTGSGTGGGTGSSSSISPFPQGVLAGTLSSARADMASAVCNNKFVFAGGYTAQYGASQDVDIFDPATNTIQTAQLSLARYSITGISNGTKAFFAGGCGNGWSNPVSRIDIYDAGTDTWSTAELSIARHHMAVAAIGDKVFFAGGITNYPAVTSRVDIYSITTNTWSTAELSEPRGDFAAAVVDNKILFAGGRTNTDNGSTKRVDIYDATTNSWSTTTLSSPYIGLTSIVKNGKAYFTGSNYGLVTSNVEVFDAATNSWSTILLTEGKVWIPVGTSNNKIAFIGGMLSWFNHSKKIEVYNTLNNTWHYTYMNTDLMFQSIISYNNVIYSAGGAENEGDYPIAGIYRLTL
jgi:hypothetical protein